MSERFEGTADYVATDDLKIAVNAAVALERPLLIKGEPGTGKTILAHEVAKGLGRDLITWHIKSTTKAQQGLYEYDAVSRLRDGQLGDERVRDIANYIKPGKLWDAFDADTAPVRFQAPLPPTPWSGVKACDAFTTRAPQLTMLRGPQGINSAPSLGSVGMPPAGTAPRVAPEAGVESEDCLHLNVYTPALRDHRKRPVLVYGAKVAVGFRPEDWEKVLG